MRYKMISSRPKFKTKTHNQKESMTFDALQVYQIVCQFHTGTPVHYSTFERLDISESSFTTTNKIRIIYDIRT